ncbi:putative LRR receptor-like serine/threonine-protein kinase [Cinnamomum micranthum f. kanehirae]|uniref:Putative LRR receptor-like serine/threonine-protein kinase n=1 Tax=Cinnamomum micranthum f. kanehirae TaxID=337451 RepID=A0A443NHZ4_9MAGN|nr:putative LRR receptor-like serine/threonine-protein kinase [Cinnamomum micranthum f. kanehirae]
MHSNYDLFVAAFVSIDCGIAEDYYTDVDTRISYTSDAKFIETGTNKNISEDYISDEQLPRQYRNLRIFPDGTRNCYTLTPVTKNNRYLLRASFMYGNYDGLNQPPQFDAYVGVHRWEIDLPFNSSLSMSNEIIMVASLDYISVCLVNTGEGTPYISMLELRQLDNLLYEAADETQSLRLLYRNQFRPIASGPIRYPDDAYDRIWSLWEVDGWAVVNTTFAVDLVSNDAVNYRLPLPVMNTAVIPSDPDQNLSFYFPTSNGDPKLQYHVYMHFAELQQLKSNQSREFNIIVNGDLFYGPFSPIYRSRRTIYSVSPLSGKYQHEVVISKTTSSTLPPIFNAEEIFVLELLSATPTDSKDVDTIMNIKTMYQIKRNWMGDPCVPSSYIWEGLNCSYPESKPPTIISLDVSNNSLTGPVPGFLAELSSLKILKLTNNQFTGSIPAVLLEKSKVGSLSLSFDCIANLRGPSNTTVSNHCEAGSSKKRRKIVIPILASSISVLVMLIIMVFVLWKFRQRRRQTEFWKSICIEDNAFPYRYCNSNNLTEKSDVYSFGVVLLQLITGKPAIVRITNSKRISLIDWAIPMVVGGDIRDVIDPKFEGSYDMKSIQKVAEIAHSCTSQKSIDRPHMGDVVVELKQYIINEKALESAPESGGFMDSGPTQRERERDMVLLWLSILMSLLALAVSVQGQSGFLSIDCGIPGDLNYTDDTTQMFYTSDAKFIDTGTNKEIAAIHMTQTLPRQYRNLRIFPDRIRNCYTLTPVIKSNRYLLRASFMYGNYDGLDQPPQFDAYIGVDRWEIDLPSNSSLYTWNEIIMVASLDYISVCLVNTGKGTPFISALELRLLDNSTYLAANEYQSLRLLHRSHFRLTASGTTIRYPDDAYDRIWTVWVRDGWTPINNSSPVNLWSDDYRLPLPVINTAVVPSDPDNNLSFYFPTSNGDPRLQYHVYIHFAELQQLKSNQSREFNVTVNGNHFYGPFSPKYLSETTGFNVPPWSGKNQHEVVLFKTASSTLPPIFNAEEIFVLEPLSATPTDSKDVDTIMNIKAINQIKRNGMVDPCGQSSYIRKGSGCTYTSSPAPKISWFMQKETKDFCSYTCFIYFGTGHANNYGFCTLEIYTKEKTKRYCNSNNLTEKSDVYSFGVVLLQLITGKPAIVQITNSERISLIDWAIPMVVGGDIRGVIDPKFEGNYDMKSIQKVAEIAHSCTSQKSIDRPHMRDVVVELKEYIINEKALASAPGSGGCMNSGPVQTSSEIMSYLSAR